jgi:hypothetical protein
VCVKQQELIRIVFAFPVGHRLKNYPLFDRHCFLSTGNRSQFTLHYLAMINRFRKLNVISVLLLMLMAACSAPPENAEKANDNSTKQNTASQSSVAQNGTPTVTSNANISTSQLPVAQPAPAQTAAGSADSSAKPGEKSVTKENTPGERAPRLLVPAKKLDFGKQPQEKTLSRTFQIKNVGNADLQIESVTPG